MEKKKTEKSGKKVSPKMDFEKALKELEEIASRLEEGELNLDESIAGFEKGMKLSKFCHEKLEEAEKKIELLQKNADGEIDSREVSVKQDSGEIDEDEDLQGSLL